MLKGFRFCGLLLLTGVPIWGSSIASPRFEANHPAPDCSGCFIITGAAAWFQLNTTYALTFPAGQRLEPPAPLTSWLVDLEANSVILASDGILNPAAGSFTSGPTATQTGEFLRLKMANTNPSGGQVDLDAISLDASPPDSPEPASLALLAGGLAAVVLMRRRSAG